jgi:hypothetical protein
MLSRRASTWLSLVMLAAACESAPPAPVVQPKPAVAPPAVAPPAVAPAPLPMPGPNVAPPIERNDDAGDDAGDAVPTPAFAPDDPHLPLAVPAGSKRYATAVLMFAYKLDGDDAEAHTGRVFQPLVCSIKGKRAVGARCGDVMPAHAKLRTAHGELAVTKPTKPFHDVNGEHTYPAPYGPACCMYNTCRGNTVRYQAAIGDPLAADPHVMLAVWPADADLGLEVATADASAVKPDELPARTGADPGMSEPVAHPMTARTIDQAIARNGKRYVALRDHDTGVAMWNLGQTWITGKQVMGMHGFNLLATVDVDHDGRLALIALERWANDFGLDVFGEAAAPLYNFSCGNI